jgi:hypothetical protein
MTTPNQSELKPVRAWAIASRAGDISPSFIFTRQEIAQAACISLCGIGDGEKGDSYYVAEVLITPVDSRQSESKPDKLWCAMCATWGNHQSGTCPELEHLRKPEESSGSGIFNNSKESNCQGILNSSKELESKKPSICSEHQEYDPVCKLCNSEGFITPEYIERVKEWASYRQKANKIMLHEYQKLEAKVRELSEENEELQLAFDLSWDAQMRAVAEWRKQDPEGRKLKLPDMKDHTLWLITELSEAQAKLTAQADDLP